MPAVSVIVLVYKVEEYIERCARSLFGQTLEDIEYVFVDDCTPDASMEILERVLDGFPQRRSQVKVLHNEVNQGQAYSRRRGVEAASGDYIIHCDSDDWVEPDMYAKLYCKATAEGLDMVMCRMRLVYPDHVEPSADKFGTDDVLGALIRQDILDHLPDKLITRKAYEKGITYPKCNMSEDSAMLIQLACNCGSFGVVDELLYNYCLRWGSTSYSDNTVDKIEQMRQNYDLAFSCLEARGLAGRYRADITNLKCWLKSAAQKTPRDYYMSLYPEVDMAFLSNRRFTLMQRLGHLTMLLGIHGISKPFSKKKK